MKWSEINVQYMSEESSGQEFDDTIIVHHPQWRSSGKSFKSIQLVCCT